MRFAILPGKQGLSLVLLLCFSLAHAQKEPMKFGNISSEHLSMTSTPIDPEADAVYLGCYGFTHYESRSNDIILVTDYHFRVKILKASAVDEFATIALPEYVGGRRKDKVGNIKAACYNLENGQVVTQKMAKEGVMEEKLK